MGSKRAFGKQRNGTADNQDIEEGNTLDQFLMKVYIPIFNF